MELCCCGLSLEIASLPSVLLWAGFSSTLQYGNTLIVVLKRSYQFYGFTAGYQQKDWSPCWMKIQISWRWCMSQVIWCFPWQNIRICSWEVKNHLGKKKQMICKPLIIAMDGDSSLSTWLRIRICLLLLTTCNVFVTKLVRHFMFCWNRFNCFVCSVAMSLNFILCAFSLWFWSILAYILISTLLALTCDQPSSFSPATQELLKVIYFVIFLIYLLFPVMQALDTFNTAVVSPIYYVMFTSLTILASVIMFKVNSSARLVVA